MAWQVHPEAFVHHTLLPLFPHLADFPQVSISSSLQFLSVTIFASETGKASLGLREKKIKISLKANLVRNALLRVVLSSPFPSRPP